MHVVRYTHDLTLVRAIGAAIDRVTYHLDVDDDLMASVYGAIVRKLLGHWCGSVYASTPKWAAMLGRWNALRPKIGVEPLDLAELIDHHANVLLVEATRTAEREVITSGAA